MAKLIKKGITILFQDETDPLLERQRHNSEFDFTYYDVNVTIRIKDQRLFNGAYSDLVDEFDIPFTKSSLQTFLGDFNSGGGGIIALVPLIDANNIDWVLDTNAINTVTLEGNRTLDNPSILTTGTYVLIVKQDAIGSRTLSYGTSFKFPSATTPILTITPNAVDILTFVCDSVNMYSVLTSNLS